MQTTQAIPDEVAGDLYSHVTATMQEDAAAKIETAFGAAFRTVR